MKRKLLVVEDEKKISNLLKLELNIEGYDVIVAHDGKEGLYKALTEDIDLVLLDVMLPEMNGLEVLRKIRKEKEKLPIILLTARDMTLDKVTGLDLGANDYVTKPFEMVELLARIRSSLRQADLSDESSYQSILTYKDLEINVDSREVRRNQRLLSLTPKEFDLLVYLMRNQNKVMTRTELLTNVWDYEYPGETNVVDVFITHLRKKLEDDHADSFIQTIRGVGYMIKAESVE